MGDGLRGKFVYLLGRNKLKYDKGKFLQFIFFLEGYGKFFLETAQIN